MRLLGLKALDVIHDVADALLHGGVVELIEGLKQRSPDRHIGRAVGPGTAATELQSAGDRVAGELSVMLLGELCQIGRSGLHGAGRGTVPFAVDAVARRAILREHFLAGSCAGLLNGSFFHDGFLVLRQAKTGGQQQRSQKDHALIAHAFLLDGEGIDSR